MEKKFKTLFSGAFVFTTLFTLSTFAGINTPVKKTTAQKIEGVTSTTSNPVCSCVVPLDSAFADVPFQSSSPYYSCDDGSFGPLSLPFIFCYYGDTINSVYINNNGNISFGNPYSMFISSPFPNTNYNMITPFWADIDTRSNNANSSNGRVRYKITPTSLIVKWDSVGYFPMQGNKRNSFQLTITNGSDTTVPGGNNVSFCYGDMQWTSGGNGGLSGTPSTTGVNKGDGINYFQITRCNHDSTDYDGPYGNNDGISYLDGKSFFLSTCTGGGYNVPPIAVNEACDTVFFHSATDSTLITVRFIGPESNQIVNAQLMPNPNAVVVSSTSGVDATLTIKVFASALGSNPDLVIVATDNAGATTTQYRHIVNNFTTGIPILDDNSITFFPNPTKGITKINLRNSGQIKVLNTYGQTLLKQFADANKELTLDFSSFPTGVYFLQYENKNQVLTKKIVKE